MDFFGDLILIFFFKLVCLAPRLVSDFDNITAKIFWHPVLWRVLPSLEYDSGGPSKHYISENATRCDDNSRLRCAGEEHTNYVYETNLEKPHSGK